jgi:hypothetical protein
MKWAVLSLDLQLCQKEKGQMREEESLLNSVVNAVRKVVESGRKIAQSSASVNADVTYPAISTSFWLHRGCGRESWY